MLIKICGITRCEEIKELNRLKPDYIGFVFAKSRRRVTKEKANNLIKDLNSTIKTVGVFRDNSIEEIREILLAVDLDIVQLHGNESDDFIENIRNEFRKEIWKAVSMESIEDLNKALEYRVDILVLDSKSPGGGQVFPWEYLKGMKLCKNYFLAGGINEENVLEGIKSMHPIGVDVSSGVESEDEQGFFKDKDKMNRFIRKVRNYNEGKI